LGAVSVFAGNKTEKIEIKGNCGMCESRIEKAVKAVDGVSNADWDKTTKKLEVTFDDAKTSADKIEMAVAKVGHDTPHHKAADDVYNKLPDCCKYDRAGAKADNHAGHQH
jgi:copper chaperone CopZ